MTSFTQPVERAPAASVPLPVVRGTMQRIKLSQISASKYNPRHADSFDKQGQLDLEQSIRERGLLQNLVVRPVGKDCSGKFELMGGERRYRALKSMNVDEIEVRVIAADDGTSIATQLVENMDRKDLTPLEEAEGFAKLREIDPEAYTTAAIAKLVGKTERFVQQRLQMARNLSPAVKKALAQGDIKVEQARTLAIAPKAVQEKLLDEIDPWELAQIEDGELRSSILEEMVPEEIAAFDVALYKGGFHQEDKKRYFTDVEQFNHLQDKAADALVAKLKASWPDVRRIDERAKYDWAWGDTASSVGYGAGDKKKATGALKIGKDKLTAVVWIENGRLRSAEGVAPVRSFPQPAPHAGGGGGPKGETAEQRRYRQAYNAAVFEAVGSKPDFAMRVLLLRFIDGTTRFTYDHTEAKRAHEAVLPKELLGFVNTAFQKDRTLKLWETVRKLKADDVVAMVGKYTARSLSWQFGPAWQGGNKKPPEFTALIAGQAKAKLPVKEAATPKKAKAKAKGSKAKSAKAKKPAAKKKAATSRKKL